MQIYAHRAGRGLSPENTLAACETVLELDIDFIDVDIGMTQDGQLVATHDATLNPDLTRGVDKSFITETICVHTLTYEQLAVFDVGQINPQAKYASYFPDQKPVQNARIPLLKELIAYVLSHAKKPIGFQFEIKTNPAQPHLTASPQLFAEKLCELLHEMQITLQTEIQSFDFRSLLHLQKLDARIKTTYLTPPLDSDGDFTLWSAGHDIQSYGNSIPKMIHALGGKIWGPFQMDVTQNSIKQAKDFGIKIVPWGYPEKEGTEFNHSQIMKLIEWEVDGIITDRPDRLRSVLRN